jgi:signal transduction histidine kinase
MGSRGRSIRLSIYAMVAIPLVTMLGLFGVVAYKTVNNAVNLDRAPTLIRATSVPMADFTNFLQDERRAAVVYLSAPTQTNLAAYKTSVADTQAAMPGFVGSMNSPATRSATDARETAAVTKMVTTVEGMQGLRNAVLSDSLAPLQALQEYTQIITLEPAVFLSESDSLTDATASEQSLGLIASVAARENLEEEDAVLAGALAARTLSVQDRAAFDEAAAERQANLVNTTSIFNASSLAAFNAGLNKYAPATLQSDLTGIEGAVISGAQLRQIPITSAGWQQLTQALETGYFVGGINAANTQLNADSGTSARAWDQVAITSIAGGIGLILTLVVTILVGRSIIRRLGRLRGDALALANEQLPTVVAQLRRGEQVDASAQAPALSVGGDEIGQVGQAFDTVRQTAIRAAIEEARLRQGISDVFRNLARRNQSLLHRQLTVLDAMERRATDPEALDDLFRLDHLTTRMRRHAEGLIILSGAPPGRSWSSPVKMIDVMRGAAAEVEDYARVNVVTQTKAALSGAAVTDVIHLLAELIENATTLSPPYTTVRVSGEIVPHGFAIEIEDRGLGMSAQRLAELNERLSHPPEFNPSNTEQLGLFVVSQLAHRHGVHVILRPSPYGGTTAIVLVPRNLVVAEEALMPGATGMPPLGPAGMGGPAGVRPTNPGVPVPGLVPQNGFAPPFPNGNGAIPNGFVPNGAVQNGAVQNGFPPSGFPPSGFPPNGAVPDGFPPNGALPDGPAPNGFPPEGFPPHPNGAGRRVPSFNGQNDAGQSPAPLTGPDAASSSYGPGIRISGAVRRSLPDGGTAPGSGKVVPGVTEPPDFDAFAPAPRDGQSDDAQPAPDSLNDGSAPTSNGGPAELPPGPSTVQTSGGDELPRRVRQASLAPQLRKDKTPLSAPDAPAGPPPTPASPPMSLTEIRSTMSAMQRGWQQARAEAAQQNDGESNEGQES